MISDIFKFPLQGFYQAFNQLPPGEFIPSIVRTMKEKFQYLQIITQTDVLAVSDGAGILATHVCAAHNVVTGELQKLLLRLNQLARYKNSNVFMFF